MHIVQDILIIILVLILFIHVYGRYLTRKGFNPMAEDVVVYNRIYVTPRHRGPHGSHGPHGPRHYEHKHRNMEHMSNTDDLSTISDIGGLYDGSLSFGTFENPYTRGECDAKNVYGRSDCMVGNCNIGTNIADDEFCNIQCAQDPDPQERKKCYDRCIDSVC
jgi:hypothetical protein